MNFKNNKYQYSKRLFDIVFSLLGIIILASPLFILGIILKLTSIGPIIHWSNRAGVNNLGFKMAKLRTMKIDTPVLAENLLDKPGSYYTCLGKLLRKYGIDELPQLYNILLGEMSFVGPRPVLFSDNDLIAERIKRNVCIIRPGLTGLAQINGRSELTATEKAGYDEYYMNNMSFSLDMKIIFKTNFYLICENFRRNHIKGMKGKSSLNKLLREK